MSNNENKGEGPNKSLLPPFVQYTEWLWLSFLSAVLFISGIYVPNIGASLLEHNYLPVLLAGVATFVGTVFVLIASIPISLIGIRQGIYRAFIAVMSVSVFLFLSFGNVGSISFALDTGLLGILFCYFVKKTNTAGEAVFGLIIVALISKLILMGYMYYYTNVGNPFLHNESYIDEIFDKFLKTPGTSKHVIQTAKQYILLSIPTILIAASSFEVFVNYLLISKIEGRWQRINNVSETKTDELRIHPLPPFELWSFPNSLLAAFIFALIIPLFNDSDSSIMLLSIELNIKSLSCIMFFIQGLSFTWWWISLNNFSYGLRLSIFFILFFLPVLSMGFIIIGIFDIALNLRKRIRGSIK